jgi:cephalosporin hydroxylase
MRPGWDLLHTVREGIIVVHGRTMWQATGEIGGNSQMSDFAIRNRKLTAEMAADREVRERSLEWLLATTKYEYSYHFTWLGLPIIQYPQDILAVQEILWSVKPELIVETGIARGGSLALSASMLELIGGTGTVVGVDVDIRAANRVAIEGHTLAHRIVMIEGSSTDPRIVEEVRQHATGRSRVVVMLDSNHTHDHVLRELELYSPLVGPGGYIIVFDTVIEDLPADSYPERPWNKGNNPATAVRAFLAENTRFQVDHEIDEKLLITVARGGYLKCVEPPIGKQADDRT